MVEIYKTTYQTKHENHHTGHPKNHQLLEDFFAPHSRIWMPQGQI